MVFQKQNRIDFGEKYDLEVFLTGFVRFTLMFLSYAEM